MSQDDERPVRSGCGCWVWGLGGSALLFLLVSAILVPGFIRSPEQGRLTACKSNLKNVSTALEMYSTDFEGRYPSAMAALTPDYLKTIPECRASGKYFETPLGTITLRKPADTYSSTYEVSASPDAYTVFCSGHHHARTDTPPNYPQYNSHTGLVER